MSRFDNIFVGGGERRSFQKSLMTPRLHGVCGTVGVGQWAIR